ncbi:MAG: cell division protein FtsA [Bacteroidota bacterium]
MENSEIIVGLDIGTTKIAVIVGRKDKYGKIEILGFSNTESIGVMRGQVANIDKTVESIKIAIAEAEQKAGVQIGSVYVGVAGQHIKSIQHKGSIIRDNKDDVITKEDIRRLINNMRKLPMKPGEDIIHVLPQDFIIDGTGGITEPVGMMGVDVSANFHIITGHTAAIRNIEKCVQTAGLEVDGLILEPIASSDAVLSADEKEEGVALIDIGGGTTDIAIFQNGIIRHTAVIPLGGNIITEDIKEGCSIIRTQAEALKIKFGSAVASENSDNEIVSIPGLRGRPPKEISLRNLASIVQARVEEILDCAYFEIKNSGFDKKISLGIVLTGGGAMMKHISQLTEFISGKDVRIGYPNEHLANNVLAELANPIYATGVGLVIKGLNDTEREAPINKNDRKHESKVEETVESKPENEKKKKPEVKIKEPKKPKEPKENISIIDKLRRFFDDSGVK